MAQQQQIWLLASVRTNADVDGQKTQFDMTFFVMDVNEIKTNFVLKTFLIKVINISDNIYGSSLFGLNTKQSRLRSANMLQHNSSP